jgi:histidine ammonia-lyase
MIKISIITLGKIVGMSGGNPWMSLTRMVTSANTMTTQLMMAPNRVNLAIALVPTVSQKRSDKLREMRQKIHFSNTLEVYLQIKIQNKGLVVYKSIKKWGRD